VFVESLGHEKLSAVSMPGRDASAQIIVLNSDLPASAQRFALAHEIGHLIMHTAQATPDMEREADRFASSLLMPADDIRRHLRRLQFRDLGALKAIWHVPLAALIYRAHDLGEITDRHYQTLNMSLNKLPGGRKREPGEFPSECPSLMRKVVEHYQKELGYTIGDLAALAVTDVASFQRRYLQDETPRLKLLESGSRSTLSVN
jgi:Zn-dependent peptidase ImmA (M78 family)